jgi:hypothetical protein
MARKKRQRYNQGSRVSHRDIQGLNEQRLKSDMARLGRVAKRGAAVVGAAKSTPFAVGLAASLLYKKATRNPSQTRPVMYSAGLGTHGISVPNPRWYGRIDKLDKI